jgi:hypothetical protein
MSRRLAVKCARIISKDAPPLIIEKSEIDHCVNALDESLAVADEFVASLG